MNMASTRGVQNEHYINSSGLKEIIEGSPIAKEFKHIFACSYMYNKDGEAEWPGIAVDYTAKTQYIFKINKEIFSAHDNKMVNESIAEDKKRIPYPQMIYFGDGETDIPCMKIVKMFGVATRSPSTTRAIRRRKPSPRPSSTKAASTSPSPPTTPRTARPTRSSAP